MPQSRLRSLKHKINFSIAVLIAAVSVAFYYYSFNGAVRNFKVSEKKQVELIKQSLITDSEIYLTTRDNHQFEEALARVTQNNDLAYVVVTDSKGEVKKKFIYNALLAKAIPQTKEENSYIYEGDTLTSVVAPITHDNKYMGKVSFGFSKIKFNNAEKLARREFVIISAAIFVGGILLTLLISFLITRPFNAILKSAKKIVNGDYGQRITTKRTDEFSLIANTFNSIAEKLEESNSQVIHLNNKLKTAFRDKLGELNLEINQRRIAEASLKKSEEQFRLLFNIAPIGMVITTPERNIQKVNKAFENTLGYSSNALLTF